MMIQQQERIDPVKVILKLFKRLSVFLFIEGRRGTGKTDLSLLIVQILAKYEVIKLFASNIKIYNSPVHIEPITNLQDLEHWCKNNKGKKLFVFDEMGKSIRRRTPMSALNIQMIDNLQILRKYKLSIIGIAPADVYVDSRTLGSDVIDAKIVKPYFDNQKVALYVDLLTNSKVWLNNIPSTIIDFDTWDIAPFVKDSPIRKPDFKDKELSLLWEWSHGKSPRELEIHNWKLHRILVKFVKKQLETSLHITQQKA